MNIIYTRHSKQRMKLYNISEETVMSIIESGKSNEIHDGKIIYIDSVKNFPYPIKIISKIENDLLVIISCYPLKRRN